MLLNNFMLLVALGSTSVLSLITKRDAPPDNTDGAYKVAFKCTNSMGGPSDYTHNDELKLAVADGSLRSPDECHEQDGHPAIAECTFNDDAFEGGP
ncbi:hypothetical protein N7534_003396 [Penicillium rubens]|nr:hypothetical protein N7534_003396 [Penicillium rubens]